MIGWWGRIIEAGFPSSCLWFGAAVPMLLHIYNSNQVAGKPANPPKVQPIRVYAALALNSYSNLTFQGRV
jgi:hypothetical protein